MAVDSRLKKAVRTKLRDKQSWKGWCSFIFNYSDLNLNKFNKINWKSFYNSTFVYDFDYLKFSASQTSDFKSFSYSTLKRIVLNCSRLVCHFLVFIRLPQIPSLLPAFPPPQLFFSASLALKYCTLIFFSFFFTSPLEYNVLYKLEISSGQCGNFLWIMFTLDLLMSFTIIQNTLLSWPFSKLFYR